MVTQTIEHAVPKVGMISLVGVSDGPYPMSFGNYFSLSNGPYIVNMWAENFTEWFRRHPAETVEITVLKNEKGFSVAFVTDPDVDPKWLNKRMCVTGHGWGSRELCEAAHDFFGVEVGNNICGCEAPDQAPRISQSFTFKDPKTTYHCWHCDRVWEADRG